jgi:hypothetical protein
MNNDKQEEPKEDEKIEQAIVDYTTDYIIKNDYENYLKLLNSNPKGFQIIFSTWVLEVEVNNGGFNQFFYNNDLNLAKLAYESFIIIEAKRTAEIVKEAIEIFNNEKETISKYKEKRTMEAFMESYKETKLNSVDSKFYNSADNLSKLRIKFIRLNPEQFITSKTS